MWTLPSHPHHSLAARPPSVVSSLAPLRATMRSTRRLRAEGNSSNGGSDAPALPDARSAAVLARIQAAKQYASSSSSSSSDAPTIAAAAAPPPPPAPPAPTAPPVVVLAADAQQPEQQPQEEELPLLVPLQPPPPVQPPAWALQAASSASASASASDASDTSVSFGGPLNEEPDEAPRAPPRRPDFYTAEGDAAPALPDLLAAAPPRADGGSADRPAAWLAGVLGNGGGEGDGQNQQQQGDGGFDGRAMRPEAFTAAREALSQQQGATIISADPNYDPGFVPPPPSEAFQGDTGDAVRELERQRREQKQNLQQAKAGGDAGQGSGEGDNSNSNGNDGSDDGGGHPWGAYRPKVSTWGVFDRPTDISAAYGGGRTIKPGQALETPEQRRAREADYKTALAAYRKKAGLDQLTPEQEADARSKLERADALFRTGKLREASALYDEARELVPLRTTIGGRATLGAAVCLDSLGMGAAARELYVRLRGHPDASTARTAKRLTFGFDAAKFLKADTITYARGNKEYAKYFRKFADSNRIFVASEEERERDRIGARNAALVAAAVMAAPVAGVLALVVGR